MGSLASKPGLHPRRQVLRGILLLAFVGTVCTAPGTRAEPVAARIGTTIASVEWQLERLDRCQLRANYLQRRRDRLLSDSTANAAAIADAEAKVAKSLECVQSSSSRASSLEMSLASLRQKMLASGAADASVLEDQLDALRALERERAKLALDIRLVQYQLDQLRLATPASPSAISQKLAVLDGMKASLATVVSRVAAANQALADYETAAEQLLANRRATLNWTVPTTRENGAPLPVGELGGYEIYMLAESTGKTSVFTVDDPMKTTYTVEGLVPDTYHFSMSAYDLEGAFSPLSDIVAKSIQ